MPWTQVNNPTAADCDWALLPKRRSYEIQYVNADLDHDICTFDVNFGVTIAQMTANTDTWTQVNNP